MSRDRDMDGDALVFGIDLGTTNSCVARVGASGKPEVLENADQMVTTPSVVAFTDSEVIVGVRAKRLTAAMPDAVCTHVKRRMGMSPDDPAAMTRLGGHTFSPEEISALILRKVVNDALASLGKPQDAPVRAVITVPAYFTTMAKNATMNAASLAGIDLLDLIHEPVAAAVAYGLTRVQNATNILVYDLGGGTFDATVVRADGESVRTIATDGERLLGGRDWDEAVVNWLQEQFEERYPGSEEDLREPTFRARLFENAEQAKIALSQTVTTSISLHHGDRSVAVDLTRELLEQLASDKLELTISKTEAVLAAAAKKGATKIDRLLLVGGSSKMPAVARHLGKVPKLRGLKAQLYEPDLAVAKGAALLADKIVRGQQHADLTGTNPGAANGRLVTMVNAKSIGTVLQDRNDPSKTYVHYVIPRNADLPVTVEQTFFTVEDNQPSIHETVVEERGAPSAKVEENTVLHDENFRLPISLPADSPLKYRYTLDGAGMLHVFAVEPTSGATWEMQVNRFKRVCSDDILRLRPVMAKVT